MGIGIFALIGGWISLVGIFWSILFVKFVGLMGHTGGFVVTVCRVSQIVIVMHMRYRIEQFFLPIHIGQLREESMEKLVRRVCARNNKGVTQ